MDVNGEDEDGVEGEEDKGVDGDGLAVGGEVTVSSNIRETKKQGKQTTKFKVGVGAM